MFNNHFFIINFNSTSGASSTFKKIYPNNTLILIDNLKKFPNENSLLIQRCFNIKCASDTGDPWAGILKDLFLLNVKK